MADATQTAYHDHDSKLRPSSRLKRKRRCSFDPSELSSASSSPPGLKVPLIHLPRLDVTSRLRRSANSNADTINVCSSSPFCPLRHSSSSPQHTETIVDNAALRSPKEVVSSRYTEDCREQVLYTPDVGQNLDVTHQSPRTMQKYGQGVTSKYPNNQTPYEVYIEYNKGGMKRIIEEEIQSSSEGPLSPDAIIVDNDILMSPIELFVSNYNPELGEQVCAAYERKKALDDFVHRIRVRRYGKDIANEHRGNQTPIEIRNACNRKEQEALQKYLDEESESE